MAMPDLPFDLTGCEVMRVEWPARAFRMVLAAETAEGQSVEGCRLTFEAVANHHELRMFLGWKRRIERRSRARINRMDPYPLKLPAALAHLKPSRAARASYGDAAFTDAYGRPPAVGPGQRLCLFALAEKRFQGRKPFPIVFGRLALADGDGKLLGGAEAPAPRRWSTEEYRELGMRFLEAVVTGDLASARGMLSKAGRERLGVAGFRRRLGDYPGLARRFAAMQPGGGAGDPLDLLRPSIYVHVEDADDLVWESVRGAPAGFPRESARAEVQLGSELLREALFVYVVEEDGEPRLDPG